MPRTWSKKPTLAPGGFSPASTAAPASGCKHNWAKPRTPSLNCHEITTLLHAYVDEELSLSQTLEVERHLEACAACARADADLRKLRETIQGGGLYFQPPSALRG